MPLWGKAHASTSNKPKIKIFNKGAIDFAPFISFNYQI